MILLFFFIALVSVSISIFLDKFMIILKVVTQADCLNNTIVLTIASLQQLTLFHKTISEQNGQRSVNYSTKNN